MEFRKKFGKYVILFVVATLCVSFISCSKDDEDSVRNQLVGFWYTSISSSNWRVIELKSNGVVYYSLHLDENGIPLEDSTYKANWSYNDQEHTISMYTVDGYYTFTYTVNMASDGNSWAGYTTNSKGATTTVSFTRIK